MSTVDDVCRHVRSKNAGPYWITIDLFFAGRHEFEAFANSPRLGDEIIAELFDVSAGSIKRHYVPDLCVLKLSLPRHLPQGGILERDMHGGQQYIALLDLELGTPRLRTAHEAGSDTSRVSAIF